MRKPKSMRRFLYFLMGQLFPSCNKEHMYCNTLY